MSGPVDSVADVLAQHQRMTTKPGGPCWCGEWPTTDHDMTWMDHVAERIAPLITRHVREALNAAAVAVETDPGVRLGHNVSLICSCVRCDTAHAAVRVVRNLAP